MKYIKSKKIFEGVVDVNDIFDIVNQLKDDGFDVQLDHGIHNGESWLTYRIIKGKDVNTFGIEEVRPTLHHLISYLEDTETHPAKTLSKITQIKLTDSQGNILALNNHFERRVDLIDVDAGINAIYIEITI